MLVFYNDRASFPTLQNLMSSERDENGPLAYHIILVELLAACTEGKNVDTELKCNSLLPLDDIVKVVTHEGCTAEVTEHYPYLNIFLKSDGAVVHVVVYELYKLSKDICLIMENKINACTITVHLK